VKVEKGPLPKFLLIANTIDPSQGKILQDGLKPADYDCHRHYSRNAVSGTSF